MLAAKKVTFTPISSIELKITLPNLNYDIEFASKKEGLIKSIKYEEEVIKIADSFKCNIQTTSKEFTISYKANYIRRSKKNPKDIHVFESKYNKSSMFVLPFIFDNQIQSSQVHYNRGSYSGYLINTFVESDFIDLKNNSSVLFLLKFSKAERFKNQEAFFAKHDQFIKTIDIDHNYVAYEFQIPDMFKEDFVKLLDGDYSKLSDNGKQKILNYHGKDGTIPNSILNKDPGLVEALEKEYEMDMTGCELYDKFGHEEILTKTLL